MRGKRVPKVVPFLVPFWSQFWPQNGPQNRFKIGPKINNFVVHFWIPFLLGFGALWVPLGSLLGPPKALLGGLWTPKTLKNNCFLMVFGKAPFRCFGALDGSPGAVLVRPGRFGTQNGPNKLQKNNQKNITN